MTRVKSISFTQKEYDAVWSAAQLHDMEPKHGLNTLLAKMDKAKNAETASAKQTFTVVDCISIAKDVIKDRLVLPPVTTPAWYGQKNKYILSNGINDEVFRKACVIADRAWKNGIYFDTLLSNTMRLVAMEVPSGKSRPRQYVGFANMEEPDEPEYPGGYPVKHKIDYNAQ